MSEFRELLTSFQRQLLALSLRDGLIHLQINYGPSESMVFQTRETYNSGGWVRVEAARAERNGVETGVLRVSFNGAKEELMDTIDLPRGAEFQASTEDPIGANCFDTVLVTDRHHVISGVSD